MNPQIRFLITISLLLFTEVALCALSVDFSKTHVKWGEPVVLKIKVTNPVDKTIQGGITISFSGNLIVTDHDYEGKVYWEGSQFYYKSGNGHECCIDSQEIVVENWYKRWHPYETKTMTVTFFTLRTGLLKTYIRAAFIKEPAHVINIPETSFIQDQQNYPVIVKHISVSQSDDFIRNFQLLIDTPLVGDSSEFRNNLQRLINNPKDPQALKYFGIQNLKNSPDYLTQLQKLIKNPKIANSPHLMYYLKRLINNPLDEDALRFFQIKVVKNKPSHGKTRLEQAKKEAIEFINQQTGGTVLVQLIEAEGDITFVPSRSNRIVLSRYGRTYRFNKNSVNLVLDIAHTIKNEIKPHSQYINQAEPFSGKSYNQLISALEPVQNLLGKKEAKILDVGKLYSTINITDCLSWPSEQVKKAGGQDGWGSFYPKNGNIGIIVSEMKHCDTGKKIYLLKIGNYYAPLGSDGVKLLTNSQ